jgi:hypothetical protein
MREAVAHAPILAWPAKKTFDDLPVLLGWSRSDESYQAAFTHENGGTVRICGGGAEGMRSEFARWGRGLDLERVWGYGGEGHFFRCTGEVRPTPGIPRMAGEHPILYYGDGHNRLFESRAGYGRACGTSSDNKADGDIEGWNTKNPGSEMEKDDPFTVVLRPVPVDMDAIGYRENSGRREGIVDTYAPWLYRLVDSELAREGRIDDEHAFRMSRYLFVDVYARDVGGSGDETCAAFTLPVIGGVTRVDGGFRLRVVAKDGTVSNSHRMTRDYFGNGGNGVKRLAVPLAAGVGPEDVAKIVFDAYDDDGMYFLGIGDAFIPRPAGTNGAVLDYVNRGMRSAKVYVDDDRSSCPDGKNTKDGFAYPCVGSAFTLTL